MTDRYGAYERLKFDWPAERVLRITMENPALLKACTPRWHRRKTVGFGRQTGNEYSHVFLSKIRNGRFRQLSRGADHQPRRKVNKDQHKGQRHRRREPYHRHVNHFRLPRQ